jgi:uncharacterized protein (DUF3084 family)
MFGLTLIAVLAVMGGAIAYIGDKIGTKVGKRKLSMFGLRPKHTSIIVAVATGILITASTLAILTVSSWHVRTALFGMEKLSAELTTLSSEVSQKNEQLEANRLLLQEKEREYTTLVSRVDSALNQLATLEDDLGRALEQRDQTMAALARVQDDYNNARGDLNKARVDIATLEATKTGLDTKIADLSKARDGLKSDVDRLTEVTAKLRSGIEYLREGTVLYRANEVLATSVINASVAKLENELLRVIMATNQKVLQRMGKPGQTIEALWISQTDFQNTLKTLQNSDSSMVVRIIADGNTVLGEPVVAHFELYPNKQIFAKGDVIATTAIDVADKKPNMEQVVLQFLQQVNSIAVTKGVLPDPLQGTVGSISAAELFNTVNQIKKMGGTVELSAVVIEDTSVAGPLKIRIQAKRQY